jgi:WD40 repeat protein
MKSNRAFLAIILTVVLTLTKALVQEKSFILKDTTPSVFCIALYQNSLLLTSFYDIVQKDIETGKTQRTLRGHDNIIFSFVVTSDSKLISSAIDDSVVLWDLLTGSVLKRIKLKQKQTIISTISVQDDQVFTGGFDSLVRQIDLTEGRVVKTFGRPSVIFDLNLIDFGDIITSIVAKGDFVYVATEQQDSLIHKRRVSTSETSLFFTGHTDYVYCLVLQEETLFSGSNDKTIIFWNIFNGQSIRILVGHSDSVTALTILGIDLYSGSNDGMVIKWNIASGENLINFPRRHTNVVKSLACNQNSLFSGSNDKSVIRWNKLNGSPEFFYLSQEIRIRSMVWWKNFIIGGRDDSDIQLVDASVLKLEPISLMKGHISSVLCLFTYEDELFSGSLDSTIRLWNLTTLTFQIELRGKSVVFNLIFRTQWCCKNSFS